MPASIPLFNFAFGTVAERLSLEPEAFSLVFKLAAFTGLLLLDRDFSAPFLATSFDPPVLPTEVLAFFTPADAPALCLATLVFDCLSGDIDTDLPEVFTFTAAATFNATLEGETLFLALTTACAVFLVSGFTFFSSFWEETDLCGLFSGLEGVLTGTAKEIFAGGAMGVLDGVLADCFEGETLFLGAGLAEDTVTGFVYFLVG